MEIKVLSDRLENAYWQAHHAPASWHGGFWDVMATLLLDGEAIRRKAYDSLVGSDPGGFNVLLTDIMLTPSELPADA